MANSWIRLIGVIRTTVGGPRRFRSAYRLFPSALRCKHCYAPFHGLFAIPFRLAQIGPSRKNPNLCTT